MDAYNGWLLTPIKLHSSREFECGEMTPLQCAWYQQTWHFWYEADYVFALGTIYYCLAIVALLLLVRIFNRFTPRIIMKTHTHRRFVSGVRFLSYRQMHISALNWYSPSIGTLILGAVSSVFFFSMMLGPKPYYWPTFSFGQPADYGFSPPIATRSGWMALALFPFVIALPMKLNMITIVTGISHERLQVLHRWSATMMLVLGLVHTFPFIVHDIREGMMEMEWATDPFNKSGVAALFCQAYLTFFSWGFIRARFYEIFKFTHILVAALFTVFLFVHCNHTLTSWDYFIASAMVYFLPYSISLVRTYLFYTPFTKADLSLVSPTILRIDIPIEAKILRKARWNIGSHMFLRFASPIFGLECITAHPFTICSYPSGNTNPDTLIFFIKPHAGITAKLASFARKGSNKQVRVCMDGPYGGMKKPHLSSSSQICVITGGSGAGFSLPVIEDCLYLQQRSQQYPRPAIRLATFDSATQDEKKVKERKRSSTNEDYHSSGSVNGQSLNAISVVFTSRDQDNVSWYASELSKLIERYPGTQINVILHSTARSTVDDDMKQNDQDGWLKGMRIPNILPGVVLKSGRPDIPEIVSALASQDKLTGSHVGVVVCGPRSMLHEARNACADVQKAILIGDERVRVAGLYLHVETFGW